MDEKERKTNRDDLKEVLDTLNYEVVIDRNRLVLEVSMGF